MQELHIGENDAGQRFDKYLVKCLPKAQKSFLYKMLRKKNIVLNGKKADGTKGQFNESEDALWRKKYCKTNFQYWKRCSHL